MNIYIEWNEAWILVFILFSLSLTSRFANVCYQIKESNFHPLEVVNRGSETQLQVGETLNLICSLRVNRRRRLAQH